MSSVQTPVFLANQTKVLHRLTPLHKPVSQSFPMWRNIAKQAILRTQVRLRGFSQNSRSLRFSVLGFNSGCQEMGCRSSSEITRPVLDGCFVRGYKSVAEEVSSTDIEEEPPSVADEVQELVEEMKKEERREKNCFWRKRRQEYSGMGQKKYLNLYKRQVRIETEEWERAAAEYRELLADMCEQKLAPNLPYVKSLFLGWFEPLRNVVAKEQEMYRTGKSKAGYAPYIDQLPADMVAVITMHKLMGYLMTGRDDGSVKVVQAACSVGEAIEQEVG